MIAKVMTKIFLRHHGAVWHDAPQPLVHTCPLAGNLHTTDEQPSELLDARATCDRIAFVYLDCAWTGRCEGGHHTDL